MIGERGSQRGKVPLTYLELLNWGSPLVISNEFRLDEIPPPPQHINRPLLRGATLSLCHDNRPLSRGAMLSRRRIKSFVFARLASHWIRVWARLAVQKQSFYSPETQRGSARQRSIVMKEASYTWTLAINFVACEPPFARIWISIINGICWCMPVVTQLHNLIFLKKHKRWLICGLQGNDRKGEVFIIKIHVSCTVYPWLDKFA